MDKQVINIATSIDKDIKDLRRMLMDILDDIEDKLIPTIMEEPDPEVQDALLEVVREVEDKLEDALIDCPKKNPLLTRISAIH